MAGRIRKKNRPIAQEKDAEVRPPETHSKKTPEDRQQELNSLQILRDVLAHQKRFIEILSKQRFKTFLDSLALLIAHVANDQRVTFCNQRYADFLGLPREHVIGKHFWEPFPEGYDLMRPQLFEAFDGREVTFEQNLKGTEERSFHITIVPDFTGLYRVSGVFISLLDITDRKVLEEEQKQLAQQRAELLKVKDDFLATLSHELRTPLTSIVGWTSLITSGAVSPEHLGTGIAAIERNARIQRRLIDELLDLSRISAGKVKFVLSNVNMSELVGDVAQSMQPAFSEKGVRLELNVTDDLSPVRGDRERLQQVVMNLLSNALKFTPPTGCVEVAVTRTLSEIHLEIQDTGQGIPQDFLPHVFEDFRQADMSSNRSNEGLGLGMAIARRLIEMHHGSIRAESDGPGQGSIFKICLPAADRQDSVA